MEEKGALRGVRVLDLSRVLAGPYCTMILGDLGAEVIKVEAPGGSDETRSWGPPHAGGESAYYLSVNRNKRAITVDLKHPEGQQIVHRLLRNTDVLVANFKVGTLERMGLAPNRLLEQYPQLIVAEITGFGQTGPMKHLPGYDFIVQALSGMMSITGTEESGPLKVGVAIMDLLTGLYAAVGILAALQERQSSGRGQVLDLSLLDAGLAALINVASNYLIAGQVGRRMGNAHPNIVPYQSFRAADGEMVVAVGNDRQFARLAAIMGKPEWAADPRFATNSQRLRHREVLIPLLQEVFLTRPVSWWMEQLQREGIPCAPIQDVSQALSMPQTAAREMVVQMPHPTAQKIRLVGSPLKLSRTPVQYRYPPPLAGEHTAEVLSELGYSREQIEELGRQGII